VTRRSLSKLGPSPVRDLPIRVGEEYRPHLWAIYVGLTALELSCTAKAFVFGVVARRLPRILVAEGDASFAAAVTPRWYCSA
jgi:hypothetical protein